MLSLIIGAVHTYSYWCTRLSPKIPTAQLYKEYEATFVDCSIHKPYLVIKYNRFCLMHGYGWWLHLNCFWDEWFTPEWVVSGVIAILGKTTSLNSLELIFDTALFQKLKPVEVGCSSSCTGSWCYHFFCIMLANILTSFGYIITKQFHELSIKTSTMTTADKDFPGALQWFLIFIIIISAYSPLENSSDKLILAILMLHTQFFNRQLVNK